MIQSLAGEGSEEMAGARPEETKTASKRGCVRKNIRKVWRWLEGQVRSREDLIKMEEIAAISFADETDEGGKKKPL